jgi:hypothetical protein
MSSLLNLSDANVYVLRAPENKFSEYSFLETIEACLAQTKYNLLAKDSEAPASTNCITSIRYLFRQNSKIEIPNVYIGDMPRSLVTNCGWSVEYIKISEMQCGDLLFLRDLPAKEVTLDKKYIVHAVVSIGRSRIFHSSLRRGSGYIEHLLTPKDVYASSIVGRTLEDPNYFLFYIDPRNKKLREQFQSDTILVDCKKGRATNVQNAESSTISLDVGLYLPESYQQKRISVQISD